MMKGAFRYAVPAHMGDRDILKTLKEAKLIKEAAEKIGIKVVSKNNKRQHGIWESLLILESNAEDNTINITLYTNRRSTIEEEINRLEKTISEQRRKPQKDMMKKQKRDSINMQN